MTQKKIGNYIVEKILGEGTTGKVRLARSIQTENQVAIKIIKKSIYKNQPSLQQKIQREIALMRLIDHPNILGLIEVIESENCLYLVEQYGSKGSLFDIILSLSITQAFCYFRQIIYGLEYLHMHGICHRDLKPENILLDYGNQILIADFGFACWMPDNIAHTSCGSPHYAAPEVTRGIAYDGCAADVWSSGVILYAMLARSLPFDDESVRKTIKKIRKGKFQIPENLDPSIQDLLQRILTVDPTRRITIDQIKEHPATRIGLPTIYILPTPFPLPKLCNPIEISLGNESTLDSLNHIGFRDREQLINQLQSNLPNMAKVFFLMLTEPFDPDSLPWGQNQPKKQSNANQLFFEHPFVFPIDNDALLEDPFECKSPSSYNSPNNMNNSFNFYNSEWVPNPTQVIYEQEQNVRNLVMTMPSLMSKLQTYFTSNHYDWFHPNDRTIVVRYSMAPIYINLQGILNENESDNDSESTINLCVKMIRGTADDFFTFFEMIKNLLSSEIKIVSDKELNDLNALSLTQSNAVGEDYSPDQNCNPM